MNEYLITYTWYEKLLNEYMTESRVVRGNSQEHARVKLIYDLGDDIEIISMIWSKE